MSTNAGKKIERLTPNGKMFVTVYIWYFYALWHVFLSFKINGRIGRWFRIEKPIGCEDPVPHQSLFGSGTLVLTGMCCRRRIVHSCRVPARVHKVSHVAPPGHGRGHGVRGRGLLPRLRNQLVPDTFFNIIWITVFLTLKTLFLLTPSLWLVNFNVKLPFRWHWWVNVADLKSSQGLHFVSTETVHLLF